MKKATKIIALTLFLSAIALAAACGGAGETATGSGMKTIAEKKEGNVNVILSNAEGKLKNGEQEIMLSFTDTSGKPLEIKAASLNFNMPAMGTMAEMNNAAALSTTGTPGQFKGKVTIEMAGEWSAQISFEGAETGKTTIAMTAG
ncbi:MAG: FixH family protein [Pyrinomonadaceae bacterium]